MRCSLCARRSTRWNRLIWLSSRSKWFSLRQFASREASTDHLQLTDLKRRLDTFVANLSRREAGLLRMPWSVLLRTLAPRRLLHQPLAWARMPSVPSCPVRVVLVGLFHHHLLLRSNSPPLTRSRSHLRDCRALRRLHLRLRKHLHSNRNTLKDPLPAASLPSRRPAPLALALVSAAASVDRLRVALRPLRSTLRSHTQVPPDQVSLLRLARTQHPTTPGWLNRTTRQPTLWATSMSSGFLLSTRKLGTIGSSCSTRPSLVSSM